jgi:predicted ATPase
MLREVTVRAYRSLRDLTLRLPQVAVLTGPNGCGKSNCYRALQLLHAAATGRLAEFFSEEGGMPSALWAGPRSMKKPVRIEVEAVLDEFRYRIAIGLPTPHAPNPGAMASAFSLDPLVKEEEIALALPGRARPVPMVTRVQNLVKLRGEGGEGAVLTEPLDPSESMLSQLSDPSRFPELALARATLGLWRFYHQFRTDRESPLRQPRPAVRSPVLAASGVNLVSALQTLVELEGREPLDRAIADGFPGGGWRIDFSDPTRLALTLTLPGLFRPIGATEWSDGTLRYLCLVAALLTPRPPPFLVLNEPETSLHPRLVEAVAALVVKAASRCQVLITTHAQPLADAIARACATTPIRLALHGGATVDADSTNLLRPLLVFRHRGDPAPPAAIDVHEGDDGGVKAARGADP